MRPEQEQQEIQCPQLQSELCCQEKEFCAKILLGTLHIFPTGEGHTSVWEFLKCHQEQERLLELLELTYPLLGTHIMTATLLIQYDTSF